ncbi:hypothetical protein AMTRI_Chr09g13060 [Amborella trichopoda]
MTKSHPLSPFSLSQNLERHLPSPSPSPSPPNLSISFSHITPISLSLSLSADQYFCTLSGNLSPYHYITLEQNLGSMCSSPSHISIYKALYVQYVTPPTREKLKVL